MKKLSSIALSLTISLAFIVSAEAGLIKSIVKSKAQGDAQEEMEKLSCKWDAATKQLKECDFKEVVKTFKDVCAKAQKTTAVTANITMCHKYIHTKDEEAFKFVENKLNEEGDFNKVIIMRDKSMTKGMKKLTNRKNLDDDEIRFSIKLY